MFGKAVEELGLVKYVSWPEQTGRFLGIFDVFEYFALAPEIHCLYTLWKFSESAYVHPRVDPLCKTPERN